MTTSDGVPMDHVESSWTSLIAITRGIVLRYHISQVIGCTRLNHSHTRPFNRNSPFAMSGVNIPQGGDEVGYRECEECL